MHSRTVNAAIVLFLVVSAFLTLPVFTNALAENCGVTGICSETQVNPCPIPGTRPATASDAVVQNGQLKVGVCYNPNDASIGQTDEEAKKYLRTILCSPDGDNYGGKGPDGTIQGLDAKFVQCAAKFLKSARDSGINVCIREGARTVEKQESYVRRGVIACKKGALCEHPRGVAIDVNVTNGKGVNNCESYLALHTNAPTFGLKFYLGCKDAYHFVPTNAGCSAGGTFSGTGSNGQIPTTFYDYPEYMTGAQSPTSAFTNGLRQALGIATTPALSPATQSTGSTGATGSTGTTGTTADPICSPAFSCTSGIMYYKTSSCTTQVYQVCPFGCTGTACAVASSSSSTLTNAFATTSTTTTKASTTSTTNNQNSQGTQTGSNNSVLDVISNYLSGITTATSVDVGTATPVTLTLNTMTDIAWNTTRSTSTTALGGNATSGIIYSVQPALSQQTFVSNDLSGNIVSSYSPQQATGFQALLASMRTALEWAISYLKPFGGVSANQQIAD